jgi:hypothetical protein
MEGVRDNVSYLALAMKKLEGLDQTTARMGREVTNIADTVKGLRGADFFKVDMKVLERLERQIGAPGTRDPSTVLGRLTSMSGQLTDIGQDSASAAKKAQTAKTEASNAASGVSDLKAKLEKGNLFGAAASIEGLRKSVSSVDEFVRSALKELGAGQIQSSLSDMQKKLEELARGAGIKIAEGRKPPPEGEAGGPAKPPEGRIAGPAETAGAGASKEEITALTSRIEDMKASMVFIQKMMEELRYKPVVEEVLMGVAE